MGNLIYKTRKDKLALACNCNKMNGLTIINR
jgi:hypothetical protein